MPKKFEVLITKKAEQDVEEIWDYIALNSQEAANRFIEKLMGQVEKLEVHPSGHALIEENEKLGVDCYRHMVFKDYRTIFRIQEKLVYIVRVIHGSRILEL